MMNAIELTPEQRERVTEWVKRLRDPAKLQGRCQLTRIMGADSKHQCCWGVACDYGVESGQLGYKRVGSIGYYRLMSETDAEYNYYSGMPPEQFTAWMGLPGDVLHRMECNEGGCMHSDYNIPDYLAHLNDAHDYTFSQIADVIERTWLDPQPVVS
jgi:hypothetical protein